MGHDGFWLLRGGGVITVVSWFYECGGRVGMKEGVGTPQLVTVTVMSTPILCPTHPYLSMSIFEHPTPHNQFWTTHVYLETGGYLMTITP
eukprot:758857-Hanusia_phi.AAC.2